MLKQVNLNIPDLHPDYKLEIKELEQKLSVLQQKLKEQKIPVIILFEGWGASGKGSLIGKLILNLDPRGFHVYSTLPPTEEESRKPFLHRFVERIPGKGEIAIFDRSWYQELSNYSVQQQYKEKTMVKRTESINELERQLTDNHYFILKFFLHISKEEQKKRLKALSSNKRSSWRVQDHDWFSNKHYKSYYKQYDRMLSSTNSAYAPWHVVPGMKKEFAYHTILTTLVTQLESHLKKADSLLHPGILPSQMNYSLLPMNKIGDISLQKTLSFDEYNSRLKKEQNKLGELSNQLYRKKIPLIICYEGWDAAGKGGNIKRVAAALDPRDYDVTTTAAPNFYEKARHYLWRFWKQLPKTGHITIFDRTWYGRVLVERVEGFSTQEEWMRSYHEINNFEQELTSWGAIVIKFWLQIDKEEQLRRFTDRTNTPEKQWKITEEDWRNRDKWDQYEVAVNDMIAYTSTEYAPWHIIESNDKLYARVKTIELINQAIELKLAETKRLSKK